MDWQISDAAIDAYARAVGPDERARIAAGIRAAVPHVIAERVDAAGEDEGVFTDWWMSMIEESAGGAR